MEQVTVEQLKAHVQKHAVSQWKLRSCSMCGTALHYTFHAEFVVYNSNCACTDRWVPTHEEPYSRVVRNLNMQTPDIRKQMWDEIAASGAKPNGVENEGH